LRNHTRLLPITVVLGMALTLIAAGAVLGAETTLTATLAGGAAENPPGDPDGAGTATITIDPATLQVCWELTTTNIADATASHIHVGAAGANGGVTVGLDVDGFSGSSTGCTTGPDAATLQAIIDNPAGYYVNVHNADFGPGAIRGQLGALAPNTAVTPASNPVGPLTLAGIFLLLVGMRLGLRSLREKV